MINSRIPDEIIDEIASKTDIVALVREYVPLQKKGRNYLGLCPFHSEKTPSFTVSPDKNIYYCFGCNAGGNPFGFLMAIEGITFPEAVEKLAQRAGVSLPKREMTEKEKKLLEAKNRQYRIMEAAVKYYEYALEKTEAGKAGLEYLKKRGISDEMKEKFRLGFSPDSWDGLIKFFASKGVGTKELEEAGLAVRNENGRVYDRFRNRLMFPIFDEKGRPIGFGGRVTGEGEPKYLNSPDTTLFLKGEHVYGLNFAKGEMRHRDRALLVEGYMDVISCFQHGVTNAAACLGTALTDRQAKKLMKYTYNMDICYDSDSAGSQAAVRGGKIFSSLGARTSIVVLEGAKDPDEFLGRFGREAFDEKVKSGLNLIEYKLRRFAEKNDLSKIEGKMAAVREVIDDLRSVRSPVEQTGAVALTASVTGLPEESIFAEIRRKGRERENNTGAALKRNPVEIQVFQLLLKDNTLISEIEEAGGKNLFSGELGELYEAVADVYRERKKIDSVFIPISFLPLFSVLAVSDVPGKTESQRDNAAMDCLRVLKRRYCDSACAEYSRLLSLEKDEKKQAELLVKIKEMTEEKNSLKHLERRK